MLQSVEPHTGTQWPVCNEPPEALEPVGSALWNNPAVIPNGVGFVKLSQIGVFVDSINKIRGCKTPGCDGNLVPVAVKSIGLGGGLSVCFGCRELALFETFTKYENEPAYNNDISVSVQVAFILAGSTHTTYCKTLQNALGMKTVNANVFYETIGKMYPVVKAMVDDLCEVAKREMKEKNE